jgi:anti-anti-sigma regulatory factor
MNPKFHAALHQRDDVTYVKMGGVIDEDNELGDLIERISAGTVVIDLGEVERINSCGVRDWVNWLTKVEKGGSRVVLVECSPAIVSQINLVNNFTGSGVVKSFFAPYFCPNCDREKVLLVEAAEMGPTPHRAPVCRCDECDGVMEFDDMEDSYFAFLGTAKRVSEPAKIAAVVSELQHSGATDAEKSKIRSRLGSTSAVAAGVGLNASSLPSVPSLPSLARGSSGPIPTGSFGTASAMSIPGVTPGGARMMTGAGTGPGSRPGVHPHAHPHAAAADPGMRSAADAFGAGILSSAPRSGKMVYVLVAVLIAAICVLAILLFSGGGATAPTIKRTGALDVPAAPAPVSITTR